MRNPMKYLFFFVGILSLFAPSVLSEPESPYLKFYNPGWYKKEVPKKIIKKEVKENYGCTYDNANYEEYFGWDRWEDCVEKWAKSYGKKDTGWANYLPKRFCDMWIPDRCCVTKDSFRLVRRSWLDQDNNKPLKFPREWTYSSVTEFDKTFYYGNSSGWLKVYKLEGDEIVKYECESEYGGYFRNYNEKCIDKPTREVIYIKRK